MIRAQPPSLSNWPHYDTLDPWIQAVCKALLRYCPTNAWNLFKQIRMRFDSNLKEFLSFFKRCLRNSYAFKSRLQMYMFPNKRKERAFLGWGPIISLRFCRTYSTHFLSTGKLTCIVSENTGTNTSRNSVIHTPTPLQFRGYCYFCLGLLLREHDREVGISWPNGYNWDS